MRVRGGRGEENRGGLGGAGGGLGRAWGLYLLLCIRVLLLLVCLSYIIALNKFLLIISLTFNFIIFPSSLLHHSPNQHIILRLWHILPVPITTLAQLLLILLKPLFHLLIGLDPDTFIVLLKVLNLL